MNKKINYVKLSLWMALITGTFIGINISQVLRLLGVDQTNLAVYSLVGTYLVGTLWIVLLVLAVWRKDR